MRGIRKLACVSIGFSAGIFAAHYLISADDLVTATICCLVLAIVAAFLKGRNGKRILLIAIAAAVGFTAYKISVEQTLIPTQELDGKTLSVSAIVLDYPEYRESSVLLTVKLNESDLPKSETLIVSYDKTKLNFAPGDIINAELTFSSATERYGEYSDLNISKGLTAVARLDGEAKIIGTDSVKLKYFPKELAHSLRGVIADIFPEDTAAFMTALLTGDRSKLYEDTELNTAMSISGISHVVAVSGMHVAFLVGFLQLVLGQSRRMSLICISVVWVFVLMVGAPHSAVRAGIMQTMLLIAPIFRRENDSLTSMSFALAVILLGNPFACGSVGLQLSFGAIAGIMAFSQPLYKKLNKLAIKTGRVGDYVLATLASSLSVSVLTVPLIAIHFGYVTLYSALANILCLWTVSLLFSGGLILCLLSLLTNTLASLAAAVLSYGVRYIAAVVKLVSKLPFAALYTANPAVLIWLFCVYVAFALFILLKGKRILIPTAFAVVTLLAVIIGTLAVSNRDEGTVAALSVGNGQCIAFTAYDKTVVVDCGSARTFVNAGSALTEYLGARGRAHIDCLVLTHLDDDHVNGLRKLLCLVTVDELFMPRSAMYGDSADTYREIRALARANGIKLNYISSEQETSFGDIDLVFYTPYSLESSANNRGLLLTVSANGYNTLITGDASAKVERKLVEDYDLSDTDLLIVGHHGSGYSCSSELINEARPADAIISVGYNSYGHPAYRVLTLLEVYGVGIHRTDIEGNVIIGR